MWKTRAVVVMMMMMFQPTASAVGDMLRDERLPVRGHVVGGENAGDSEFPSQLALQVRRPGEETQHRLVCGASILNEHWALTAAHCVEPRLHEVDSLSVVSGTTSLSYGGTRHQLSGVLVHPGYDPVNFWRHDIALLKVVEPFRLDGSKVAPARLPRQDQTVPVDAVATVVGWGLVEEGGTTPSERLQKAELRVTSRRDCKAAYDKIDGVIHDTNLCAGVADGSAGPCKVTMRRIRVKLEPEWSPAQGDSGGPLFVGGKLVGLTSWGAGCKSRFPAVFTRVACYVDWIQQHIQ
ncbi:mite allergen Der f 3-like [Schistocerca cancellata]|uniref:mite allergen Der f 3-like n=1 Tax=Schistocerca cancellata TaxID=274614 RepID=UPI002117E120|nr:mite allergen Der f 3-like [Schistocerca cancellata]